MLLAKPVLRFVKAYDKEIVGNRAVGRWIVVRSGFSRSENWTAASSPRSRAARSARSRLCLGGRLLVSGGGPLQVARRILDSPALCRFALGRAPSRWGAFF